MNLEYHKKETKEKLLDWGVRPYVADKLIVDGWIYAGLTHVYSDKEQKIIEDINLIDTYMESYCPLSIVLEGNKMPQLKTFYVSSLSEAKKIVEQYRKRFNPHLHVRISYRGVNTEYWLNHPEGRSYPNPFIPTVDGKEPSFIPSYWRKHEDEDKLFEEEKLFQTILASELVYYGIDVKELVKRNIEKFGIHSISDLGDDDDPLNLEYYRRWKARTESGYEAALLAQHYGLRTRFLDLTNDITVAGFFATQEYSVKENGKCTYTQNINENAAIYGFLMGEHSFRDAHLFAHAYPERPKRQNCWLQGCDIMGRSVATKDCVFRIKFNNDFDPTGIPTPEKLFPPREKDGFYNMLLDFKEKYINDDILKHIVKNIVEYEF